MQFIKVIILAVVVSATIGLNYAYCAVDVDKNLLKNEWAGLLPKSAELGSFENYGLFALNASNSSDDFKAWYSAYLTKDPYSNNGLPQIQLFLKTYKSQDEAEAVFMEILSNKMLETGYTIINAEENFILYKSTLEFGADIFESINASGESYHLIKKNGELLTQASLYRGKNAYFDAKHETAFNQITDKKDKIFEVLNSFIRSIEKNIANKFPPLKFDHSLSEANSNILLDLPENHGILNFDIYRDKKNTGTVLDSSGINKPETGDMYLFLDKKGGLYFGMFVGQNTYSGDCELKNGWVTAKSIQINDYEWNKIKLQFGWQGFELNVNKQQSKCDLKIPKSKQKIYLGDFPNDKIDESASIFVKNVKWEAKNVPNQAFLDVNFLDKDFLIFNWANESKIISPDINGNANPEESMSRAQSLEMLVNAYQLLNTNERTFSFSGYADVKPEDWFYVYVQKAMNLNLINSKLIFFRPNDAINRAEFFSILAKKYNWNLKYKNKFTDVLKSNWFAKGAEFAVQNNLVTSELFEPNKSITKREMIVIFNKLLKAQNE